MADRFSARSLMEAPASEVFAYHERDGAFERLTPPFEGVRLEKKEGTIRDGDRAYLRMPLLGPLTQRWVAEHRGYEAGREFTDVQVEGPFAAWSHLHRVEPAGDDRAVMLDQIDYRLPLGPVGRLFGGGFARRKLERVFTFRHRTLAHDLALHRLAGGSPRRIAMTGASGLVGRSLTALLTTAGHEVVPLVRGSKRPGIRWSPADGTIDAAALEGFDAVVHLAGENIAQRWTAAAKERILRSRTEGTGLLARTLASLDRPPEVLVSASAVGYYGTREAPVDEGAAPGEGFLAEVCRAWEAAAEPAREAGIRVVNARLGVVLTPAGGALGQLLLPFSLGLGGPVGSGRQGFSWVGAPDAVGALHYAIFERSLSGPVNVTAPEPLAFGSFARALGRVLRRPAVLPLPAFVVRALFGEMGEETLLGGALVEPRRLLEAGYPFLDRDLEGALRHVLGRTRGHPTLDGAPARAGRDGAAAHA